MWRTRHITSRRHPLALACYGLIFLMGFFFLAGVFQSDALDHLVGATWRYVWQWLMAVGGFFGLLGTVWFGQLEDALWMERAGTIASAFGLLVYTGAIIYVLGWSNPVSLLLGVLALGCIAREIQVSRDIRKVRQLAREYAAEADR
jgi:hypothetical protein